MGGKKQQQIKAKTKTQQVFLVRYTVDVVCVDV